MRWIFSNITLSNVKVSSGKFESLVPAKAAEALGKIGDKRAIKPLEIIMTNNKIFWVRYYAEKALKKLRNDPENSQEKMMN